MALRTYDQRTVDASGAFLIGELERLDKTLNEPLYEFSWPRDIDLREDVSMADESASYTLTTFASVGGISATGKSWVGQSSTEIAGVAVDIGKFPSPLHLWGRELSWTLPELEAARQVGRPIDDQKYAAMQMRYNMDVDEMVYVGDTEVKATGLLNAPQVATGNSTLDWDTATPKQILDDINDLLYSAWAASAYAVMPDKLLLPPKKLSRLTQPVTAAGSISLLKYISEQCLTYVQTGRALDIKASKWLGGLGAGGADRTLAYTKDKKYVRFPLVPMQRTPLEHRGLHQITIYYCKLGHVEMVYPETLAYMDSPATP